jgi:hypothetical protein
VTGNHDSGKWQHPGAGQNKTAEDEPLFPNRDTGALVQQHLDTPDGDRMINAEIMIFTGQRANGKDDAPVKSASGNIAMALTWASHCHCLNCIRNCILAPALNMRRRRSCRYSRLDYHGVAVHTPGHCLTEGVKHICWQGCPILGTGANDHTDSLSELLMLSPRKRTKNRH